MPVSATPNPATWRFDGSGHDLIHVQRGACGGHKAVGSEVDQPGTIEACDRVSCFLRAGVAVFAATNQLIDVPRSLIVWIKESAHYAPVVHVVRLNRWVRLCVYQDSPPCVATPGPFALSLGPIPRIRPKLDRRGKRRKQFRYPFRQALLVALK